MKQIEVSLLGQVYMLGCPDGGETLLRTAVASVDKEMVAIREAGKVKARERIAVLAALNLAYQLAERGPASRVGAIGHDIGREIGRDTGRDNDRASASASDIDLEALIRRVDAALGDDGHLL